VAEVDLAMADLSIKQSAPKVKIGETTCSYTDASGTLLYYKIRVDYSDGSKYFSIITEIHGQKYT
jgi:hypothetical protein